MARMPPGGNYGGGYIKVQQHLRTAIMSVGFALVTTAPFTADLAVPSITQAQLTGYKYPVKQVRHTQFQDGWLYTGSLPFDPTITGAPVEQSQLEGYRAPRRTVQQTDPQPVYELLGTYSPALTNESSRPTKKTWRGQTEFQDGWLYTAATPTFDPTVAVAPVGQSQLTGYRYPARTVRQTETQDGWVYENLPVADVWDESKFQNGSGDLTPVRAALRYRYDGYPATDWIYQNLPVPDVWDESKFQNISGDRTVKRRQYDPRYEYHKFPFGLLDARVVMPAIDQLANSERAAKRKGVPIVTTDSLGWLYENLPVPEVWSEAKFQNISGDRTPTRKALLYRYDGYPSTDWIYQNLPVPEVWDESKFQNISGNRTPARAALFYRYDGYPATDWAYQAVPAVFDPQYLVHSDDSRMPERYKKVPQLDQPAQDWIYTSLPPFDPQYLIQVSAPTRMADREKLDVRLAQFYNDMAWLRDVLGLPDPPVTPNLGRLFIDLDTGHLIYRITP